MLPEIPIDESIWRRIQSLQIRVSRVELLATLQSVMQARNSQMARGFVACFGSELPPAQRRSLELIKPRSPIHSTQSKSFTLRVRQGVLSARSSLQFACRSRGASLSHRSLALLRRNRIDSARLREERRHREPAGSQAVRPRPAGRLAFGRSRIPGSPPQSGIQRDFCLLGCSFRRSTAR